MKVAANLQVSQERVERLLPTVAPHVAQVLERAMAGHELSHDEGLALAMLTGSDVEALAAVADHVRREVKGDIITYVVNRNINFTNVCFIGCKFCSFSTSARADNAYSLSFEEIARRTIEAHELGATEVCVQGGLPRGLDPFYYRDILRTIKQAVPEMHTHAFSPMEMTYGTELTGMSLRDYLQMLKDNGLDTLPGTAAEVLDDDVRHILSRKKVTVKQWTNVVRTAHRLGIPTTSTMMYGHVETPEHWVNQLMLLRDIQKETGGFTEFVPLAFVHKNTDLFRIGIARPGPTAEESLKLHALARLMLRGWIDNVQVSWVKMGRKLSQRVLQAGANDYGGTLMDENISRLAGATAGQYMPPEEFQQLIREIGRVPAERTTTYELRQVFDAALDAAPV
ncbi:MAG TPA: 5-amino-6-(D-ribitylamino)uracil--L-tyrosine 4-hydroxyphenyl transferase CofH [Candidatus Tectomicrobia bacterium]|jgi:FO synthase